MDKRRVVVLQAAFQRALSSRQSPQRTTHAAMPTDSVPARPVSSKHATRTVPILPVDFLSRLLALDRLRGKRGWQEVADRLTQAHHDGFHARGRSAGAGSAPQ